MTERARGRGSRSEDARDLGWSSVGAGFERKSGCFFICAVLCVEMHYIEQNERDLGWRVLTVMTSCPGSAWDLLAVSSLLQCQERADGQSCRS